MNMRVSRLFRAALAIWRRPVRFEPDWRLPLGVGAVIGSLMVFVILFLEPWGTDRYEQSWRTLRLVGYGPCILLAFLLAHYWDRRRWRRRSGPVVRWRVGDEILSTGVAVLLVAAFTYAWKAGVVNRTAMSLSGFADWIGYIVAPSLVVVALPAVWIRRKMHVILENQRTRESSLLVQGRNRDDRVCLSLAEFLCARAQQNYVDLYVFTDDRIVNHTLRMTLAELEQQIPHTLRVHRSWLVNPARIERILGNARQRRLRLTGFDDEIPVSPGFDPRELRHSG